MVEIDAYNEAIKSGQYEKPAGLQGKYDNVRRFWEDEQLGLYMQPYLEQVVARKKEQGKGLRIMDLGCGSGDGFELLMAINRSQPLACEHKTKLLEPGMVEFYKGIDINQELLEQARGIYGKNENMVFVQADFNEFDFRAEEPYDLYLATYGTLSHNADEQTVELLSNIAKHGASGAIIVIDWLGRYSYEWQTLWANELGQEQWMDYVISYIYTDSARKQQELTSFPLRIMGRREALAIYRHANRKAGGAIVLRGLYDRSSFVGRHMDTAQYNRHCQPLRGTVNSLFELGVRTDLERVLINYVPRESFPEVNAYHRRLADCWNYLVEYVIALLSGDEAPSALPQVPLCLRRALSAMKRAVRAAGSVKIGDPRANLIEPQLGYCLRELEMGLQQGLGCGHGLVAILELVK